MQRHCPSRWFGKHRVPGENWSLKFPMRALIVNKQPICLNLPRSLNRVSNREKKWNKLRSDTIYRPQNFPGIEPLVHGQKKGPTLGWETMQNPSQPCKFPYNQADQLIKHRSIKRDFTKIQGYPLQKYRTFKNPIIKINRLGSSTGIGGKGVVRN